MAIFDKKAKQIRIKQAFSNFKFISASPYSRGEKIKSSDLLDVACGAATKSEQELKRQKKETKTWKEYSLGFRMERLRSKTQKQQGLNRKSNQCANTEKVDTVR